MPTATDSNKSRLAARFSDFSKADATVRRFAPKVLVQNITHATVSETARCLAQVHGDLPPYGGKKGRLKFQTAFLILICYGYLCRVCFTPKINTVLSAIS